MIRSKSLRTAGGFCYVERKPTVRYHSEFVEKERKIKSDRFRHFIYVKLRIADEVCKNLAFTYKNAYNLQKNTKFFCPTLDTEVSGSPIIQDGKLVGAVTHVLVNDPSTGYGIFIENMLDAAA